MCSVGLEDLEAKPWATTQSYWISGSLVPLAVNYGYLFWDLEILQKFVY